MRSRKYSDDGSVDDEDEDNRSTHSFPQRKRRRGLSKFYSKAQSFCSLEEAVHTLHGSSAAGLEKKPKLHEASHNASISNQQEQLPRFSRSAPSKPLTVASRAGQAGEVGQLSHSCPSSLGCLTEEICSALERSSLSGSDCDETSRRAVDNWSHELRKLARTAHNRQTSGSTGEVRPPQSSPEGFRRSLSADRSSSSTFDLP